MSTNNPTATGSLASTPFCELLVYALTQALSGSLVFECPDRTKHALLLHFGSPVKARVDDPSTRLGEVLVAVGSIDPGARRAAEAGPEGQLFGQRLLARGVIDASALAKALYQQLLRQLAWLAKAPANTVFAYYDHVDMLQNWGGEQLQVDPLTAIWSAVNATAPGERTRSACQGLAGKTLRLHPASRIGRFGFSARERTVLDVLRVKPQTLAELEATRLIDGPALHKLLYVLVLTRHLDTGAPPLGVAVGAQSVAPASVRQRAPSSASRARRSASSHAAVRPASRKSMPAARPDVTQGGRFLSREEITSKHQRLDEDSYYELLEVPREASAEQIAAAFPMLARRWHPDRLSPELRDLKETVTRVFARMTEASRVLGQASIRQEYDESIAKKLGEDTEQAQVIKVLRAAEAFQKAEILVRKRDLLAAEKFAELAYSGDQDQPEYVALYAWIRARRTDAKEADIAESLALLKGAVQKQSDNVKIRYYLACVFKLSGQHAAALREFRFVADNDPSNLDAARELRLADMRKGQAQGEPAANAGLFGRLFKR